ncbi:long-chain fatty acid--CoA ligase [Solirubrobacter ginsenosidimutans]|uniref:Long-chain fatty acid--CoA ligase n=1 Tax=Solirubrobacter ginsenosidimutans TaxID=490573 RepID=A0A9X3N231_9ACTN|nr:long-chain fatty acid--CoA ligase [Solirubrobacter ginsenosidimutans]MDA0166842.1 long-chain fatty acid--CoA ligase [Solirubrobacter ginsenosidimutans]
MNLALNLSRSAADRPDGLALSCGETRLTYADLDAASAGVAARLRALGLRDGDTVGLMLPNVPEFAIAYYGILRAGGVAVPINVQLKPREVAFYLSDPAARLVLAWDGCVDAARAGARLAGAECVVVEPGSLPAGAAGDAVASKAGEDTAVVLYTSGTTGTPKGAQLTHANLARNVEVCLDLLGLGSEDVVLGALPLFHSFGQTCALNAAVAAGAALALVPRFAAPAALETIERERVTVFEGVPTMYSALLHFADREGYDVTSLRLCVSGGAALPVDVLHGFERAFGCVVLEGYGLSETSPVACFNHRDHERLPGSIGTPVAGVEMRIVDDRRSELPPGEAGEIAIRGHNVMKGYLNRPDATAETIDADGWFYTGDIARVDAQGRYFIVDRKKDLIIRGGYNVYPRELEEVLYTHPAVVEAAVIGIPHPEFGEEVGAAVVLKPGSEATAGELRAYVKDNVAAYKYPRHVWLVDALAKGSTGKVLKRAVTVPSEVTAVLMTGVGS